MTTETSRQAYSASQDLINSQRRTLLKIFKKHKNKVYCDYDLSILSNLPMHIVWSRRNSLAEKNLIMYTGTILNEDTGRQVQAWKLKP